jgi:hypothetical protein
MIPDRGGVRITDLGGRSMPTAFALITLTRWRKRRIVEPVKKAAG